MARATATKERQWPCTEAEITKERDERKQSWANVAKALGLKSPSAARQAYTDLTGRPHNQSQPILRRAPKRATEPGERKVSSPRAVNSPKWDADTDQDEIIAALVPTFNEDTGKVIRARTIYVERPTNRKDPSKSDTWIDEVTIHNLLGFEFTKDETKLMVHVRDHKDSYRSFYVNEIIEVI